MKRHLDEALKRDEPSLESWLLVILATFLLGFYRGWVLSVLWGWFAVPLLHLPPLTVVAGTALLTIVGFLGFSPHDEKEAGSCKDPSACWAWIRRSLGGGILFLIWGSLVHWLLQRGW